MNALCLYVNAARLVLQPDTAVPSTSDLNRLLPNLRQLLSCAVCCHLLNDPYVPRKGGCQHNVCRLCMRERKALRPFCNTCKDCQDFKTYDENKQMRFLLLCYKSLCEHLKTSTLFTLLGKQKPSHPASYNAKPAIPLPNLSTQELVLEGASYTDVINAFHVDLQRNTPPKLQLQNVTLATKPIINAAPVPTVVRNLHTYTQATVRAATPPKPIYKPNALAISTSTLQNNVAAQPKTQAIAPPTQLLTLKSLKMEPTSGTTGCSLAAAASNATITYVRSSTSGILIPVVSSASTPATPLTIASAKLQTLNRQLAQARANTVMPPTSVNNETPPTLTFKVSLGSSAATTTTTATITSQQMCNPPPIKTVSNGSAMYSVLYTGIGNKITIKRKTEVVEEITPPKIASPALPSLATIQQMVKAAPKRRGCRCGNATLKPGKLTCCGQRCPCYVDSKSCVGCKCRGCRNPHRPDGGKVRPVIPELARYEIQMADDQAGLPRLLPKQVNPTQISVSESGPATMLIPFSNLQQMAAPSMQHNMHPHHVVTNSGTESLPAQPIQQTTQANPPQHRESVLIQNADGNYQVVNFFTTSALQRLHTIQQLPGANSNSSNNITTMVMPNSTTGSTKAVNTTTLSQLILQPPQQPVQRQPNPLQIQSSQGNIITLHPIASGHNSMHNSTPSQSQTIQLLTPPSTNYAPIIVSPNAFATDMYSDSSEEVVSVHNATPSPSPGPVSSSPHVITVPAAPTPTPLVDVYDASNL